MNKHIEVVKKWLADKDSVSKEELKANAVAAYDAYEAAAYDATYVAYAAAYDAVAYDAAYVAYAAYDDAAYDATYDAAYWVGRYEELTNEQRE